MRLLRRGLIRWLGLVRVCFGDFSGANLVLLFCCMLLTWQIIVTFVSGYALWQIDERLCGPLTDIRRQVGMPLGLILELHGVSDSMNLLQIAVRR